MENTNTNSTRFLIVDVYTSGHGDCTNGGVTSNHKTVAILCESGPWTAEDAARAEVPMMCMVSRNGYRSAVSCDVDGNVITPTDKAGPMMGGNFIYSSDSRFRQLINEYPLPVHDRFE